MKTDLYLGNRLSVHYTGKTKHNDIWEFNILPFITIDHWRILAGWLLFSVQYTYGDE